MRRNKLAAVLAGITLVLLSALAIDSRFDGLAEYQASVLPRLSRLEAGFLRSLLAAENASGEWRGYYFENAHREVKQILRAADLSRPRAHVARKKHADFIRYYSLLDREFADIGLEANVNPNLDYVKEVRARMEKLKPIRDGWAQWALPAKKSSALHMKSFQVLA